MDKVVIQLLADILYVKQIINSLELDAILDSKTDGDLIEVVEKMIRGELNVFKKGESYSTYK